MLIFSPDDSRIGILGPVTGIIGIIQNDEFILTADVLDEDDVAALKAFY